MNTCLRVLSNQGKLRFADYLNEVRLLGSIDGPPIRDFNHSPWSTEFIPAIEIEDIDFETRMELGKYLVEKFNGADVDRRQIVSNQGMWSWLALLWFDKICPIIDGKRKIRDDSHYVYISDWRDSHRHLIAASWALYDLHKERARLFLNSPLNITNDFIEHIADNQDVITNTPLINLVDMLYWDTSMQRAKPYAQNRHALGNIRRLVAVSRQLSLTYDLQSMEPSQILELLGTEFKRWNTKSKI